MILLIGNPNVGKSVIFSKLTGVHVDSSNYAGTTVDYTIGDINFGKTKGADAIIYVLDATHLERNLDLAYKLKEYPIPVIYSLNLIDVAERQGINIDVDKLSEELGSPVIPNIAIKNIGLMDLMNKSIELSQTTKEPSPKLDDEERWKKINIVLTQYNLGGVWIQVNLVSLKY